MLGFKDGTANPDSRDTALMDSLVWVQPGAPGEPAWTQGGSYQAIRLVRNFVERWDRVQLAGQESIFGRHKLSGAPLGQTDEHEEPDFSTGAIPPTAHIRLANPRTPDSGKNLLLRRGYNYSRGLDGAGQMDMGLIFVAYQADLDAGFRTVQARLNGEELEEYIKPFGGGYFFALPGVTTQGGFLAEALLTAT
jgi:deferrochelatase/peroxidase EfeB